MLEISLVANVILVTALIVVVQKARTRIREEKLATFAGCVAAITTGLAREEQGERNGAIGDAFAKLTGQGEEGGRITTFLLARASLFRVLRMPCLADLGEHVRLLALQTAPRSDTKGDDLCDYIANPDTEEVGRTVQPREHFGDDFIASAQFEAEGQLLDLYQTRIDQLPLKLFS